MDKILILEDDKKLANFYKKMLSKADYNVQTVHNSNEFYNLYEIFIPELLILDIRLANSKQNGIEIFETLLKSGKLDSKVIILSGEATRGEIATAMKLGAYTFIEKSGEFDIQKFLLDVKQAINLKHQENYNKFLENDNSYLRSELIKKHPLIGNSKAILKVKKLIEKFAKADTDVLIVGETGTGKEIVANHIYWNSKRAGKPFVKVNSGGISDNLVDSELFGHKKGSFTGAISNKKGYFEQANGGTLFLDEISNLNFSSQAKILRAIEYKEIRVVGGELKKINLNFIFATNMELENMITENKFREDLYYRLSKNTIRIPPLREREEDIVLLMRYFFNSFQPKYKTYVSADLSKITDNLRSYRWPGNVRELEYFCEHIFIMYDYVDNEVILSELENKLSGNLKKEDSTLSHLLKIDIYNIANELFEKKYLKYQLLKNNWNVNKTAKRIGLERSTLYKKIKKYDLKI